METIGERIKQVRKHFRMTIVTFGERIGVSNPAVSMMENNKNSPSAQTILAIVREFGVDEVWLRTGVGEMFKPKSRKDEIDEYIGQISAGKRSDIEAMLIELMSETSVEEWQALAETFRRIAEKMNKPE